MEVTMKRAGTFRLSPEAWASLIRQAHELGISQTATLEIILRHTSKHIDAENPAEYWIEFVHRNDIELAPRERIFNAGFMAGWHAAQGAKRHDDRD